MSSLNKNIESHYYKDNLYESIIERLQAQGITLNNVSREDISGADEFHVRGATVSKELAELIEISGSRVLDVGCGLGGPCRLLADEFDCLTTGIDLTKEFIRTAIKLSKLVGLEHKTQFYVADALNLPFENDSFDVVWTQHVQMNIQDKEKFYSEIYRVLKPNGFFMYYDIFKNNITPLTYPLPWATEEELSFLFSLNDMISILEKLNFTSLIGKDETEKGVRFFETTNSHKNNSSLPNLGVELLMGRDAKAKVQNLLDGMKRESLKLASGVFVKKEE